MNDWVIKKQTNNKQKKPPKPKKPQQKYKAQNKNQTQPPMVIVQKENTELMQ